MWVFVVVLMVASDPSQVLMTATFVTPYKEACEMGRKGFLSEMAADPDAGPVRVTACAKQTTT